MAGGEFPDVAESSTSKLHKLVGNVFRRSFRRLVANVARLATFRTGHPNSHEFGYQAKQRATKRAPLLIAVILLLRLVEPRRE